ncbi:hypothetical protein BdWA1_001912 [Babesia duncani]|uniref:Uncharacterized protein n=1 Tax=Babesia duncani TaxID=323732 RepID=A0AAD9PLQ0_9APIC|nr:hypothetical protein BdWA1_001912 [Babesia duncani]
MDWNILCASASGLVSKESTSFHTPVVNLFKLSKELSISSDNTFNGDDTSFEDESKKQLSEPAELEDEISNWYNKDLQLWERDKTVIIESLLQRLKEPITESKPQDRHVEGERAVERDLPQDAYGPTSSTTPQVAMTTEFEMLISWLDKFSSGASMQIDSAQRVFLDNILSLTNDCGVNILHFAQFLLDVSFLKQTKNHDFFKRYLHVSLVHLERQAWSSLRVTILNNKGVFLDDIISIETTKNPLEELHRAIACADIFFPDPSANLGINNTRDPEYFFFIAYLLFRCGSSEGLNIIIGKSSFEESQFSSLEYPPLFEELCELLKDVLLEKTNDNKYLLLGRFTGEYFPTRCNNPSGILGDGSNFYALLLLSIIYADSYAPCAPELFTTREDYIWYKIRIMLSGSTTNISVAAADICLSLSKEMRGITLKDNNANERIVGFAYSIALVGGIKESLRLLMSAVRDTQIQSFALVIFVLLENSHVSDLSDMNYISSYLWNLEDSGYASEKELPYLAQLAFSRRRNVSPEPKIILATLLPPQKANLVMKYVISENFSAAVSTWFLGSAATRNGMLAIGPLLQKLIKLSIKRNAARYAISLLAQYSAHLGLWCSAFKCFYCVQDAENCASVLEACCCFLYEPGSKAQVAREDLLVYYTLVNKMAPTNPKVQSLRRIFDCIKLSVLSAKGDHVGVVSHCKSSKVFENATHVLRNESHQIYFLALIDYVRSLKNLVNDGEKPSKLLTAVEAHTLVDLLESAYQNQNADKANTLEAIHMLMTFITIVPPKV